MTDFLKLPALAGVQRRRHRHHLRRRWRCCTSSKGRRAAARPPARPARRRMAAELTVPPARPASGSTSSWRRHAGSRSAAQKAIDAGRVTVDGVRRPKRHVLGGGERGRASPPRRPAAEAPVARRPSSRIAWEDEHLLVVDKPAGVVVHPARGHRRGTLAQALAGRVGGRRGPDARRASCTGWTATRRGCSSSRGPTRSTPRSRRSSPGASSSASTSRSSTGRPAARRGTIDAPLGRDRRVRTRMSTDTDEPRPAVTHFAVERALPARDAAARAARDRPHAPDPRAPAGHRPSRGGRPGVRHGPAPRPARASSCTPRGSRSRTPSAAHRWR